MIEQKQDETQQELFQEFDKEPKNLSRFPSVFHKSPKPILVSTTAEQLILVVIVLILLGCFIFFLGVVRGGGLQFKERPPKTVATISSGIPVAAVLTAPKKMEPSSRNPSRASASIVREMTPDINKPYTLQLVTYRNQAQAEREVALLRRKGFYSVIIASGDYYQVCVGQYMTREHAKKDLKMFSASYKDCYLRRR